MSGGLLSGHIAQSITDGDKGDVVISGSGTVYTVDSDVITLAKLADIATASIIGRTTAGTGDPEVLTGTQVTALLDTFTSGAKGLAPASGGGTTNFLRADGSWAVPPGTGSLSGSGTVNTLAKWTSASALDDSIITDDGSSVIIGSSLSGTHTVTGQLLVYSGVSNGKAVWGYADTVSATTNNFAAVLGQSAGTFNTTTGALTNRAVAGVNTATRASGGNALTNIGVYGEVSGGQSNIAGRFLANGATSNVALYATASGGTSNVAIDLTGTITANSTTGTPGDVLTLDAGGLPVWEAPAGGTVDGTGTANKIAKWSDADTLADSVITDDGLGSVSVAGNLSADQLTVLGTTSGGVAFGGVASIVYNDGTSDFLFQANGGSFSLGPSGKFNTSSDALIGGNISVGTGASGIAGDLSISGTTTVGALGGTVQESSSTGTLNEITLNANTTLLRFTGGAVALRSITGGWDGRILYVTNTASTTTFANEHASAPTAANRFSLSNTTDWIVDARGIAMLYYDGSVSRWRLHKDRFFATLSCSGSATFSSTTTVSGQLNANGHVVLGDAATDNITVNGHGTNAAFLIGRQVITASGTYTPTSGTYKVLLEMVGGGGGGGGGVDNGAGNLFAAAGGGSSGIYLRKWIDPGAAITGGSVTIGAGGAGGAVGAAGTAGGQTSVTIQAQDYDAVGGGGGAHDSGGTGAEVAAGGVIDVVNGTTLGSTPAADTVAGTAGFAGMRLSSSALASGAGGSNPLGIGGGGLTSGNATNNAAGYGAGGGGAVTADAASGAAGGDGTDGVVIIWEYR